MSSSEPAGPEGGRPLNRPRHVPAGDSDGFRLRDDVFHFLLTAADTGGSYSLTRVDIPAGGGPGPHEHPGAEEWFYVLAGRSCGR